MRARVVPPASRWTLLVVLLFVGGSLGASDAFAVDIEAITSYDRMTGGAPHNGFFNNAWQPFVAQSSRITRIGVTVGNPTFMAGAVVPFNVNVRLCTTQPDADGNCAQVLGQADTPIVNYGNSYADVGDIPVTPGRSYWAVWFQPAPASGTTWVTFWWAGGATIATSDQMQMVVRGYDPPTDPAASAPQPPAAPDPPTAPPPPTAAPPPPAPSRYAIANVTSVNLRTGPGTNYPQFGSPPSLAGNTAIEIVCQTVGTNVNGSTIWDQLTSGAYVSDWYATTPVVGGYSPGIPLCGGAPADPRPSAPQGRWSIAATSVVSVRSAPSTSSAVVGSLGPGARFDIACQTYGTVILGSPVWDQLSDGRYIADYFTDTPVYANFSPGIPVCAGTGPRPAAPNPATVPTGSASAPPTGVTPAPAPDCSRDILYIGARGSDDSNTGLGRSGGRPVEVALGPITRRFGGRVRIDSLDYVYPAMALLSLDTLRHFGQYLSSVDDGRHAILNSVQDAVISWKRHCKQSAHPRLHIFLVGYSQGAWAVGDVLEQIVRDYPQTVTGVVLFGDPERHGSALSHGIAGNGHVFRSEIRSAVRDVCHPGDPVCDLGVAASGQILAGISPWAQKAAAIAALQKHFTYASSGDAYNAGVWMADQLGRG